MDDPLDFENGDPLMATSPTITKRKKVIELDDLLNDYYKEKNTLVKKKGKKATVSKGNNSDEEDDKKTRTFSDLVNNCQKQVSKIFAEDDIPLWGQKIFGHQKSTPQLNLIEPVNCELLQSFKENELNSFLELDCEKGDGFLEGLLMTGWLSRLAFTCGFVEDPIASWTFYLLLYSSNEELQVSACDFWCNVLLSKDEADRPLVRFGWFPAYSLLKDALEVYGYLPDTTNSCSSVSTDSGCEGPPENIWSWVNVLSACCRFRSVRSIFSALEAADLLTVIINLSLDRQLQGMSITLNECMHSVIGFFSGNEWDISCKNVAHSVACRIPKDLNCVRLVECISVVSNRGENLRSQLAFQTLMLCFDEKVTDGQEILKLIVKKNVKDKNCDFFELYIYLVLIENWLLPYHSNKEREAILDLWHKYLRNCSTQITSTDWRPYASKVRNKASYLLQNPTR